MNSSCFVPNCKNTAVIPFPKDRNSTEKCLKLLKVHVPSSGLSSFICVKHYNDIRRHREDEGSFKQHSSGNMKSKSGSVDSTVLNTVETNELEPHSFVQQNNPEFCGIETDPANELLNCKPDLGDDQDNLEPANQEVSKSLEHCTYDREYIGLDQESSMITLQPNEALEEEGFDESLSYCGNIKGKTLKLITADVFSKKVTYEKIQQTMQHPSMNDFVSANQLDNTSNYRMTQPVHQSSGQDSDHCGENGDFDEQTLYEYNSLEASQKSAGQQKNIQKTYFNNFRMNDYIVYKKDKMIGVPVNDVSFNTEIQKSVINEPCTGLPEKKGREYSITEKLQGHSVKLEKCRLCMRRLADTKNIFNDYVEQNVPIYLAIQACFSPMQICRTDKLSERICLQCWVQLKTYFHFRKTVLQNDKTQRELSSQTDDNHKRENDSTSPLPKKIKIGDTHLTKISVKNDFLQPLNNRKQDVYSDKDESLAETKGLQGKEEFFGIEDELRKVLRNTLSEEQASAENIIIHVQDDNEFHNSKTVLVDVKDPPAISNRFYGKTFIAGDETIKKTITTPARREMIVSKPQKLVTIRREVKVPKSERKILSESFKSDLGIFDALPISYLYNTEFCLLNGYLFEYRLHKGNARNLKCILPTCRATAVQEMLSPNKYKAKAEVIIPHNHKRGSEADKRKQMFFYIMRRKLQSDKGVNFKSIYEIACKQDPFISSAVPLKSVIQEVCRSHARYDPTIYAFEQLYTDIEEDSLYKLQFTLTGKQFYQNQFTTNDSRAILFANPDIVEELSSSKLMYVDASFKIDTSDKIKFQLVTILMWLNDSYYPGIFVLINKKTKDIYKKVFEYIRDTLAPKLRPAEIVTDFEANLYYTLGEIYVKSSIGGSVFYFTQNLYKKICALDLCKDLETNSYFRNIYHMLLMLPLLPVTTILDGLMNLEIQSKELKLFELMEPLFQHVRAEWIEKVTPDMFCAHRLENRINENVMAPFRKLRDLLLTSKGKIVKPSIYLVDVVEKLIELENYLQKVYSDPSKKYFTRDLSCTQKKNVLKAWDFIESHPKININTFSSKVLGYIKCMENQLWIWGFYRYTGDFDDELISCSSFSIVANELVIATDEASINEAALCHGIEGHSPDVNHRDGQVVVEGVIDEEGSFVLQDTEGSGHQIQNTFLKYVCDT